MFFALTLASSQSATFIVSTTDNAGPGSLRQAILDANGTTGDDAIVFTTNGIITLASALPIITSNTTITGPGTNLLTISGNNFVSVFSVSATVTNAMISCLAIANGMATNYSNGAGIYNAGTLVISNCVFLNNENFGGWGGAIFNSGTLAISNSLFFGNQATGEGASGVNGFDGSGGGGAGMGGALFSLSGTVTIAGCDFTDNSTIGGNAGSSSIAPGRGGGVNGGPAGVAAGGNGGIGGFGGGGGGGARGGYPYAGNGGTAGFGGGGGGGGGSGNYNLSGSGGAGNFGGGSGAVGGWNSGGGAGGGAALGGGIFVDSGTMTIMNSLFDGNYVIGGIGANDGSGVLGGVFTRAGTVNVSNSLVNVVSPSTPLETWTNNNFRYLVSVGTPMFFSDGQLTLGNIIKRAATQISFQTSFPAGTIVYSLDGSDPRTHSTLYASPFSVTKLTLLRAVAYNSNFTAAVEMDPVQITILPTLTIAIYGGGTVSIAPTNGPYFSNSVAQITAQPASGCAFLQWLGDASGTNPVTTVTMNRNKYVQAVFGTTLATNVVGGGALLVDPFLPLYPFGTTVKLTAQPQSGNYFVQWGASASGTNNPLSLVVSNANSSVTAIFSTLSGYKYPLTVIESGHGHVVENPRANAYSNGQSVSLTALPDAGQDFIAWSGDASGTQNPLLVMVSSNKVIIAKFTKRPTLRVGTPLEGLVEDGFRLTILGDFGVPYSILGSTNLFDWTAIGSVTNAYGTAQLTDPTATNLSYRFYRAASP